MKTIKIYSVPNTNLAKSENYESLRKFADERGHSEIKIVGVEIFVLEDGDKITISKCYGSTEDENGVSTGGDYRDVSGVWTDGVLRDENGKRIQCVDADMTDHFPYKNVRFDTTEEVEVKNNLKHSVTCSATSDLGRYAHKYGQKFHRVNFYDNHGNSKIIFSEYPTSEWTKNAIAAIEKHNEAFTEEETQDPTKVEQYRFEQGSLFEYDSNSNSYIHCFKCAGYKAKSAAIKAYESQLYYEEMEEESNCL